MILSDVDGVLTDGTIALDGQGDESKSFSTLDGYGIRLWRETGYAFGLITGRSSSCVLRRAEELHLDFVRTGTFKKRQAVEEIAAESGLSLEEIAYIGDDFPDLPAIEAVGLGVTVPNAPDELRIASEYITKFRGGFGAARDLIEMILKCQGKWNPSDDITR
ncbi:3-deoxy-D-manno-octulosonate 8-phosphate phosphatase [Planctomycetales bacterium]|nr:3-deoxy-D-manno-octulosonate 8-phosphate phosphatase [Planctomycetales bacterium]GHT35199.1 3-deoxy-D-manno-octulosonate 8-phosphate phosphatase [Planctomycetales bacterium]